MFLLIDAGNTRTKYACYEAGQWLLREVTDNARFELVLPHGIVPERIVIANVAGHTVAELLEQRLAAWADRIEWLRPNGLRCGVINAYQPPEQLGADRWAMAIGAWHLFHRSCLIVCAGTATTIDLVIDGSFVGGCILPGLDMMRASLARGTANLPLSEGRFHRRPRNTRDAIVSGCINAQLGAVERIARELPQDGQIVVTGGAAQALLPYMSQQLSLLFNHEPWLILEGLRCVAQD